ncbi:N-acetyltransferase [Pseudopedobacter beijingensis]|uniref:N-acetyltransferase n=1 Tax=Pseudopedobacter beijingensis TaxID=1207056 RepID=A0ABW4IFD1_9SPHI
MIRSFENKDLDCIISIWLKASILAHDFVEQNYWIKKSEDMRKIYLPSSHTFVFFDQEKGVIGFISLVKNYIAALFVSPEWQGKGIGKQLMDFAKQRHPILELGVYSKNSDSIIFYKKQGFKVIEKRVDEHTGEEETVMVYSNNFN